MDWVELAMGPGSETKLSLEVLKSELAERALRFSKRAKGMFITSVSFQVKHIQSLDTHSCSGTCIPSVMIDKWAELYSDDHCHLFLGPHVHWRP